MGHTVKCFTKVKVDDVSLVRCIDYIIEYNKQLLSYGSVLKKPNWNDVIYGLR